MTANVIAKVKLSINFAVKYIERFTGLLNINIRSFGLAIISPNTEQNNDTVQIDTS
jgi:hypothetical protein